MSRTSESEPVITSSFKTSPIGILGQQSSLVGGFLWTLSGNVAYSASNFVMLIVMAKLGAADVLGSFALSQSVVNPMAMFLSLGMRQILAADAKQIRSFLSYMAVRCVTAAVLVIACSGISLSEIFPAVASATIFAFGIFKAVDSLNDVTYGQMQRYHSLVEIAKSLLLRSIAGSIIFILMFAFTRHVAISLSAVSVTWLILFVVEYVKTPKEAAEKTSAFSPRVMSSILKDGLPMGMAAGLYQLADNMPRYALDEYAGMEMVGIFAAVSYPLIIGRLLIITLSQSIVSRLASLHAERRDREFFMLLAKVSSLVIAAGLIGIGIVAVAGDQILTLLYNRTIAQYQWLLLYLSFVNVLLYLTNVLSQALNGMGLFRYQFFVCVLAVISSLSAYWFVPQYGLFGAVLSTAVMAIAQFIGIIVPLLTKYVNSTSQVSNQARED